MCMINTEVLRDTMSQRFLDLEIWVNQNLENSILKFFKIDISGGFIFFQIFLKYQRRSGWWVKKYSKNRKKIGVEGGR